MDQPGPPAVLTFTLALAAGLAVAVCLTVGFASSGEAVTPQETVGQDPPYLSPDPETVTREEYTKPGIDVSAAAAADAQNVRGRHRAAVFSERFDGAEDPAALVAAVTDELGARAEALDQQHAQLLATYSDDEISTGQLLRELVRQEAAAAGHRRLADRVVNVSGSDSINDSRAVREQSEALDDEILALESPVTDALADGQTDPRSTVYAQAGTDTLVLALTNRTHMQRQTTLRNQREKNAPNQFIQEAGENENPNALAINRAEELYGGDNGAELAATFLPPFDATVYRIEGNTIGSSFVGYLDGATTNIFHEKQTVTMSDVPVSGTLTDTSGDLELTVETTTPTGPMRVSVTSGGEPVEGAELLVTDQPVGTTDGSGQTWVTQPLAGATVRVTVDEETATVTLP